MSRGARILVIAFLAVTAGAAVACSARAAPQTYRYEIESSTYGDIGTYTNVVTHSGDEIDVRTELQVTIRFFGFPVYHQDANRFEEWRDGRLIAFRSDTNDDGTKIHVTGKAEGDHFVVKTPTGTIIAPATVHPSNPWVAATPGSGSLMSTKTGKVVKATVIGGGEKTVTIGGRTMQLHQFLINSNKHQMVWVNSRGVVVAFETPQHGMPIEFVLKNASPASPEQVSQQGPLADNSNIS